MKKLTVLLLSVLMLFALVGCTNNDKKDDTPDTPKEKHLLTNVGYEPTTLDPETCNVLENSIIVLQMYDGLYREGLSGEFEPALAESYTVSDDGLIYTFTLREGLTFADGSPLTAEDVKYSWTRTLDPETAAEYAFQAYYIKNGAAFNAGEATADDLGLVVIDERTIEVTLENPTPYFVSLTGFTTLMIISKDFVEGLAEGVAYGSDVASTLASGPFKPVEWKRNEYVLFEKNENYWDAANVKLDKLTIYAVDSSSTEIQMYETDALDVTYFSMSSADMARLTQEGVLKTVSTLSTRYVTVNNERPALDDPNVRMALELALDRKALAEQVITNAYAVGGFIPNTMAAVDDPTQPFRKESLLPESGDVELAKQLLADAGYPDGVGFPELEMIYTTSESNKAICEALAEMWHQVLGITVKTSNLEGTVRRERKVAGDFDMTLDGWSTDYLDPFSFLEILMSGNSYNYGRYSSAEYDAQLNIAKTSLDQAERQAAMEAAEKIMIEDMAILPLTVSSRPYLQKDNVTGIIRSLLGQVDFKYADK